MIITTTHEIQGMRIDYYMGIVSGIVMLGLNVAKGYKPGRDDFCDLSEHLGSQLITAQETAMGKMQERAIELGANAVVGVDIKYENLGGQTAMSMVTVFGTAVLAH